MMTGEPGATFQARLGSIELASLTMGSAGILHLLLVPEHWSHVHLHGGFFLVTGIVQLLLAHAIWRGVTPPIFRASVLLAAGLIALWVMTRVYPAPFVHGAEEVDIYGVATIFLEAASVGVLMMWRVLSTPSLRPSGGEGMAGLLLAGIVSAGVLYQVAIVIEHSYVGAALTGADTHTHTDGHVHASGS